MSPLEARKATLLLRKIGPSIVKFAETKAPVNEASAFEEEETKEDIEQPKLLKTLSYELEQKLGFSLSY